MIPRSNSNHEGGRDERFGLAVAAVAAVALTPAALAAGTPSGKYKTKISHDHALGGELNATWVLDFTLREYKVFRNGKEFAHGVDEIIGMKIAFSAGTGHGSCMASGTYKFKLTGKKLAFTVISDSNPSCIGRRDVLTHGAFKKVG